MFEVKIWLLDFLWQVYLYAVYSASADKLISNVIDSLGIRIVTLQQRLDSLSSIEARKMILKSSHDGGSMTLPDLRGELGDLLVLGAEKDYDFCYEELILFQQDPNIDRGFYVRKAEGEWRGFLTEVFEDE